MHVFRFCAGINASYDDPVGEFLRHRDRYPIGSMKNAQKVDNR